MGKVFGKTFDAPSREYATDFVTNVQGDLGRSRPIFYQFGRLKCLERPENTGTPFKARFGCENSNCEIERKTNGNPRRSVAAAM